MGSNLSVALDFLKAMMNSEHEKLIHYLSDDVFIVGASGIAYSKEELETYFSGYENPFRDVRNEIIRTIIHGETVIVESVLSGVHIEEYMGIPPTHQPFEMPMINIFDFKNGKIEVWKEYMNTKILLDLANE
jgi:steroid delta-isomerase-like uncharacterized protein